MSLAMLAISTVIRVMVVAPGGIYTQSFTDPHKKMRSGDGGRDPTLEMWDNVGSLAGGGLRCHLLAYIKLQTTIRNLCILVFTVFIF